MTERPDDVLEAALAAWFDAAHLPFGRRMRAALDAADKARRRPRPLDEWHEDYGDVLWWRFPIHEAPYVGSPLDTHWPDYHTHWSPLPLPEPPAQ